MKTSERRRPSPNAEKALQAFAGSPGRPLEEPVRREMESRLGHDFAQVRVFDDPGASEVAEALNAEALAVGQSLFFAPGRYRPTDPEGRDLLAHELAHTVQQRTATVSSDLRAASPEAERAADAPQPQPKLPVALARRSAGPNLDPATLVQSLARLVARNLRRDPNDARGDVRRQLERLTPEFRESLVERLDRDLTDAEMARVRALLGEAPPEGETAPRDASAPTDEEAQAQTAPQGAVTSDTPETTPTDTSETDGFFGSLVRGVLSAFGAETETNPAIEGGAKAGSVVGGETAVAGGASSGAATVAAEEATAGGATELSAMTEGGNADPAALDRIENAVPTPEETRSSQTDEVPEAEGPATEAQAAPPLSTIPERVEPSSSAPALPPMADLSVEGAEVVPEWAEEPEPIVSERTGSPAGDDLTPAPVAEFDAPETAETEAVGGDVAPTGEAVSEPVRPLPSEESQPEAADAGGGGACGGGGGGEAPANAEPEPAASATGGGDDPDAVFAGAASGTPTQIGAAIGPAREAACASAAALREEVLANAPTIPRPTGAPDGAQPAPRDPGATPIPPTVARTDLTPLATTEAPGPEGPTGAGPTIAAPRVAGTAQGQLSEADAVGMAAAVESLPVSDPGLALSAELPATMEAVGATDPAQVEAQRVSAATAQTQAHTDARNDAARPRSASAGRT